MTEALARRAAACKSWRWLPGMLTDVGERVTDAEASYLGTLPDLEDPATLGCLLVLVREAWDDQTIAARFSDEHGHWAVDGNRFSGCALCCDTEAAALVAALEGAP